MKILHQARLAFEKVSSCSYPFMTQVLVRLASPSQNDLIQPKPTRPQWTQSSSCKTPLLEIKKDWNCLVCSEIKTFYIDQKYDRI